MVNAPVSARDSRPPPAEDHKPAAPDERARIVAAGGFLSDIGGITRVNGNLNLSRAIGDLRYKMNSEVRYTWSPARQTYTPCNTPAALWPSLRHSSFGH